jgi:Holliday junction DNA helicase RuvA
MRKDLSPVAAQAAGAETEAVSALVNLGYREADADRAVREAVRDGTAELADVIRAALKNLSG